jgi:hypothetical protein
VFPSVHGQYSIALLSLCRLQQIPGALINLGGPFASKEEFLDGRSDLGAIDFGLLKAASTGTTIPQLPNAVSVEVFKQLRKSPRLDERSPTWDFRPVREFDATNDRKTFDSGERQIDSWPVLGGAGFNLWQPDTGEVFAWANPATVKSALFNKRKNQARTRTSAFYGLSPDQLIDENNLPCRGARIAFRLVTNATNTRTLIAALVPPDRVLTNAAPYLLNVAANAEAEAYLLGVLSSRTLDWYARRFIELNVNMHIFNGFPIPRPESNPVLAQRIIELSGRLAAVDERFADWAKAIGAPVNSVSSETERQEYIAELESLVARMFELNEFQLTHIFETFQRGWDYRSELARTLSYFDVEAS